MPSIVMYTAWSLQSSEPISSIYFCAGSIQERYPVKTMHSMIHLTPSSLKEMTRTPTTNTAMKTDDFDIKKINNVDSNDIKKYKRRQPRHEQ